MKMIMHQTPRVNLPIGLLASLGEGVQEQPSVFIVVKDRLAPVSSIHHVINRPRILHSKFSRHTAAASERGMPREDVKPVMWKNFVLTPLRSPDENDYASDTTREFANRSSGKPRRGCPGTAVGLYRR